MGTNFKKLFLGYFSRLFSDNWHYIHASYTVFGIDLYGLISIYALLNAWFAMFDIGLGGTLTKHIVIKEVKEYLTVIC